MFTNPLNRKNQTGGSVPDKDANWIKKFINWLKTTKKEFKDKSVTEIAKAILNMTKTEEGNKSIEEWKEEFKNSENNTSNQSLFAKKGGKMQQFICKHGRGGVNCGCGGGKVVRGAEGMETPGNPYEGWKILPRQWRNNPDGSTQAIQVIISPDGNTGYQRIITDRSQMGDRNGMAVRDTVYGGGAYGDGKVWVDASQNLTPQEKAALDEYLSRKVESKQDGGGIFDTVNAWFNNNPKAAQRDTVGFKDFIRGYKGPGEAEDTIVETLPNGWQRRHRREWQGFGNAPEHKDTVIVSPSGIVFQPEVVNPDTEKIESNEFGGVVMGKDGLSRKQVRRDKREVLRKINRPTAGAQYEDLVDKSRNWGQYQGMSRLERKNAINQYLLGRTRSNGDVTDIEPGQAPDLSSYYAANASEFESGPALTYRRYMPTITFDLSSDGSVYNPQSTRTVKTRTTPSRRGNAAGSSAIITPIIEQPTGYQSTANSNVVILPEGESAKPATDAEGNIIVKDEGNGVYWVYNSEGKLEKHEPVVRSYNSMRYTSPTRNYSWTGQIIPKGASYWQAFKKGETLNSESKKKTLISNTQSIEKYQKGKGKEDLELEIPITTPIDSSKVEYIYFPKITPFGLSRKTATFKGSDGRTHTWVKYSDGVYNWKASPGYQMNTYSPKQTEVNVKKVGLAGVKDVMLPIDETIMLQIDNLMKKINK